MLTTASVPALAGSHTRGSSSSTSHITACSGSPDTSRINHVLLLHGTGARANSTGTHMRLLGFTVPLGAVLASGRRRGQRRPFEVLAPRAARKDTAQMEAWFAGQVASFGSRPHFDPVLSQMGMVALDASVAPARFQEPWRYTDLQALLYDHPALDESTASSSSRTIEAAPSAMTEVLEDISDADLRLVFIDGALCQDRSRTVALSKDSDDFVGGAEGLRQESAAMQDRVLALLQELPERDIFPTDPRSSLGCAKLAALNQVQFEDCAIVCLHQGSTEEDPPESGAVVKVAVTFLTTGSGNGSTAPRLLIDAGCNRRLHLVETHVSLHGDSEDVTLSNGMCRVLVAEGADVRHDLLQQRATTARFVESVTAEVATSGSYQLRVVQNGSRCARINAVIALQGEKATCELLGAMAADGSQQLDLHSTIHHSVPSCKSKQEQRNISGGTAECIFKGSIVVTKEAQQTDSEQLCRSLLLSRRAKVNAMPSLQIQADDVTCSHGASVTELDKDQIFYMGSRGLSTEEASRLMLVAFPRDVLGNLKTLAPKAVKRLEEKLATMAESAYASHSSPAIK